MVYGHANGRDIAETLDEVARYVDMGYKAIRAQCGIPGLASTYGVSKDRMYYEPADSAIPTENLWSTAKYLDHAPKLFDAIRTRFGFEHHILHDVHHRLTPIEAARLGKSLEPYRLFWMEDPTPAENQEGFRIIRQHTVTPIAVGEVFNTIFDCQTLITEQLIDYIRTTVVHAGGITHLRRIAHLAELYHVRTGCHGATDLSPVVHGRGAALRHVGPQLRRAGVHAAHRRDRRSVSARVLRSRTVTCIPAMRRATASISTRSSRRHIRTGRARCRSTGWRTARCGIGRARLRCFFCSREVNVR